MSLELLSKLKEAVIAMEPGPARELTEQALQAGLSPLEILRQGLIAGLEVVGEKFKNDEIFLPEVMISAKAFQEGFHLLEPRLKAGDYKPRGKILIGTVKGDVHDIGKNIVAVLLQGNGFEVVDAGADVPVARFLQLSREFKPDVIGLSALLTTTMPAMKQVVEELKKAGLRDRVKVMIGGAPVTQEYAEQIGADGYGEDAQAGVILVKQWLHD
jgi:5-methyltetrahydrofolate--homocysteine methyltransferase